MRRFWGLFGTGLLTGVLVAALWPDLRAQQIPVASLPGATSGVCAKPVLMTVIGQTLDRPKMLAYAAKLRDTKIYPRHAGYYLAAGKPVDVFEGPYPDNQSIIVARFPCLARAREFWYSRLYQHEVLPLRAGAGTFSVAVYEELAQP